MCLTISEPNCYFNKSCSACSVILLAVQFHNPEISDISKCLYIDLHVVCLNVHTLTTTYTDINTSTQVFTLNTHTYLYVNIANQMIAQIVTNVHFFNFTVLQNLAKSRNQNLLSWWCSLAKILSSQMCVTLHELKIAICSNNYNNIRSVVIKLKAKQCKWKPADLNSS